MTDSTKYSRSVPLRKETVSGYSFAAPAWCRQLGVLRQPRILSGLTSLIGQIEPLIEAQSDRRWLLNILAAGLWSFRPYMFVIAALANSRRAVFIFPGWSFLTNSARPWLAFFRHKYPHPEGFEDRRSILHHSSAPGFKGRLRRRHSRARGCPHECSGARR
jgi:hypothetical protein